MASACAGPGPARSRTIRLIPFLVLCLLAALAGLFVGLTGPASDKPAWARYASPYENVQPGVKFVGDAACTRCHAQIASSYGRHPMGVSLGPIASAPTEAIGSAAAAPLFSAQGLEYAIEDRHGRVVHVESRRDSAGRPIARNEAEVSYVLGSGRQAYSFLIERDGFLFQSPITWYARVRRWDLSPNYELRNYHFDRPILSDCLFCHTNRVERAEGGAINRYRAPIFHGFGIGCERCHGPGERHIREQKVVDGRDLTIVNPADLEPPLRDAVCEQCHLIGRRRIVRPGTTSDEFRPGLPFYAFWSAFVLPESGAQNRFAGQVEQMHESRCYRDSGGGLGCISCHDPHVMPSASERAAHFRARCLTCHADRGCSLAEPARRARNRDDDCTACHMPRSGSSNNTHVATTNHRVPRLIQEAETPASSGMGPVRARTDIVNFHDGVMSPAVRADAGRDRGIALTREGKEGAALAIPLLRIALSARPHDLPALEALAEALAQTGKVEEGLAMYRRAAQRAPDRETALSGGAALAARAGQRREAIGMWEKAIAVNPWRSDYHAELARLRMQTADWAGAAASCQNVLRLNPVFLEARRWLVQCHLRLGQLDAARAEFQILLSFDPPNRASLIGWFESQTSGH